MRSRVVARISNLLREAKALTSSDFEAALLKATRPDFAAPKPKHVESIAASIGDFELYAGPECDPYSLLLHKIWSRAVEPDARTAAKATLVLRRCLEPSDDDRVNAALTLAYGALRVERSAKSNSFYFDPDVVAALEHGDGYDARRWRGFVVRYWKHVDALWRLRDAARREAAADETPRDAALRVAAIAGGLADGAERALDAANALPPSALTAACARQILEDLLALRVIVFACAALLAQHHALRGGFE